VRHNVPPRTITATRHSGPDRPQPLASSPLFTSSHTNAFLFSQAVRKKTLWHRVPSNRSITEHCHQQYHSFTSPPVVTNTVLHFPSHSAHCSHFPCPPPCPHALVASFLSIKATQCAAVTTKCQYVWWSYLISCNFCLLQACHDETSGRHRNSTCDGSRPRRQETNNTNRSFPFARFFYRKTVNDWFETGARNCGSPSPPAVCLIAFTSAWVTGAATTVRIFHVDLRSAQQKCWEGIGLGGQAVHIRQRSPNWSVLRHRMVHSSSMTAVTKSAQSASRHVPRTTGVITLTGKSTL